ncbi:MAG: DUF1684 domain-containing protein [Chloroflexota bacterium]
MTNPDFATLADWRRRIADLYASVREIATSDPQLAWIQWRRVRDELYRVHPQSPVPADGRSAFQGRYWPYDPAFRFEVQIRTSDPGPAAPADVDVLGGGSVPARGAGPAMHLPMSSGDAMTFARIGEVRVPLPQGPRTLGLFWMAGYAGGLFLPFRDDTNGSHTYGAGRYLLDAAKSADLGTAGATDRLILDFNFAFQPSCAFDPQWSCPLAPPENRLDVPIEAGERIR